MIDQIFWVVVELFACIGLAAMIAVLAGWLHDLSQ